MFKLHMHHLLLQVQLVHFDVQPFLLPLLLEYLVNLDLVLDIDPSMILQVFFHQSEIWSSISSSLHFHGCSSWISWTCKGKLPELPSQSVVSVFFWVLYSSSVWLSQFLSIKQPLQNRYLAFKAISKCGSPLFRFQFCHVTSYRQIQVGLSSSPVLSSAAGLHEAASFVSSHMIHSHHWAHLRKDPWSKQLRYHCSVALAFYRLVGITSTSFYDSAMQSK